jgi:hypothetical protein
MDSKQASNASRVAAKCRKCKKLECRYQGKIDEIYSLLNIRFKTMDEKLSELHELQDMRDKAAQAWSEHKRSHRSGGHGRPGITSEGKRIGCCTRGDASIRSSSVSRFFVRIS